MNGGYTFGETVADRWNGRPLLDYLASAFPHDSREAWRARIEDGSVRVDGLPARSADPLRRGQRVAWDRPPWEEPEAPLDFGLVFEDADLLAVDKPSGLPTLPGAGFLEHTLLHQVRSRFPEASPVHRLGRATSGLVLFARTPLAASALCALQRERGLVKVYRALVAGSPGQDAFAVEAPIGPVPHAALGTVHAASPAGKPSRSEVRVLARLGAVSLVEVRIETGRPHQIRIHMAFAGHPLAGDPLYGPDGLPLPGTRALPGDPGYHLHALRLSLPHPRTGEPLELECPAPPVLCWPRDCGGGSQVLDSLVL